MYLQLAPSVGKACVIVSATVKYGRITVLGAIDIKHKLRTSIKGQVLANLVAKFIEPPLEEVAATKSVDEESVGTIFLLEPLFWKVYVDDVANQRGSIVGLVLEGIY